MKKLFTFGLLLVFLTPVFISAQNDTLFSMKGNILVGTYGGIDGKEIAFTIKKKKKEKKLVIHKLSVFSLKKATGEEIIFYEPDSLNGFPLSKLQMKSYIEGIRFAKKYYHNPLVPVAGVVAGVGGGYLGFWGLLIPTAVLPLSSIPNPGTKQIDKRCPEMLNDPYFVKGYKTKARKKNLINSVVTGFSSFVVAILVKTFLL